MSLGRVLLTLLLLAPAYVEDVAAFNSPRPLGFSSALTRMSLQDRGNARQLHQAAGGDRPAPYRGPSSYRDRPKPGGANGRPGGRGRPAGGLVLENPKLVVRIKQERTNDGGGGRGSGASRGSQGGGGGVRDVGARARQAPAMDQPRGDPGDGSGRRQNRGNKRAGPTNGDGNGERKPRKGMAQKGRGGAGRGLVMNSQGESFNRKRSKNKRRKEKEATVKPEDLPVAVPEEPIAVQDLAALLGVKGTEVIKCLMLDLGVMATITQSIDPTTAKAVVEAFGRVVAGEDGQEEDEEEEEEEESTALEDGVALMDEDDESDLVPRAPVVTIMGHVDHGKTSLLDAIRRANVVSGEAGGITQHIGAYRVESTRGEPITFIDTPGHAAFGEMRQRGADVTDIVILVVAADDGVKDQTVEALAAARSAGKEVIVAFNKCDKPEADVNRVATELTAHDLLIEDLGGDIMSVEVSAKQQTGLDDLLDKVMLQAEVLELKANPTAAAQGAVIEARMEKGLGTVATTLVQRGTLKVGDFFIAGAASGKVRMLITDKGDRVKEAGPGVPVQVVGMDGVPSAGDMLLVGDDESMLADLAEARAKLSREKSAAVFETDLRASISNMLATGDLSGMGKELREVNVVIKGDVQGSVEALQNALQDIVLEDDASQVKVKVLPSGVGEVTKSDVSIAAVSNAWVIAFNVAANYQAQEEARLRDIEIGYYSIVYEVLEEVEVRMQEVLSPTPEGEYVGKAEIKAIFDIGKVGKVAGCAVVDGEAVKTANVRVLRGSKIVYEGKLKTLKHVKEDVQRMAAGSECGINFKEWEEMEEGDVVEFYAEA